MRDSSQHEGDVEHPRCGQIRELSGLVYKEKRTDPRTEPWRTPNENGTGLDDG